MHNTDTHIRFSALLYLRQRLRVSSLIRINFFVASLISWRSFFFLFHNIWLSLSHIRSKDGCWSHRDVFSFISSGASYKTCACDSTKWNNTYIQCNIQQLILKTLDPYSWQNTTESENAPKCTERHAFIHTTLSFSFVQYRSRLHLPVIILSRVVSTLVLLTHLKGHNWSRFYFYIFHRMQNMHVDQLFIHEFLLHAVRMTSREY